jgi:ribonuclease-3
LGPGQVEYVVVKQEGPAHHRCFTVAVKIAGQKHGAGIGSSKKEAEEEAARKALGSLERSKGERKRRR